jgi:type I restriction enzyme M protein
MSSEISTEGEIRKRIIEADLVDCMVALPAQLFYNTQIPACIWFLARNKEGNSKLRNRINQVLFIDAREVGTMISRKQKELTQNDILKIANTYHNWRSNDKYEKYQDEDGFCKNINIEEIRKNNYILTPGRYIDFKQIEEDDISFNEKMQGLTAELKQQMEQAGKLDEQIKQNLAKIGFDLNI